MKNIILFLAVAFLFTSCVGVDSGHKGVEVSWGGETNMNKVYGEGLTYGFHWISDDMVEYDVREKTIVKKFEFNDKNNMLTPVKISIDFKLQGNNVNKIHSTIGQDQLEMKILTTLSSAAKEVIPQYSAVELNLGKRDEAEKAILAILQKEFPDFYVDCSRVRITDVDIPKPVADLAEQTAVQLGRNELASKKEAEQVALARAKVAESQGNYDAAQLDVKTKQLMSQPAVLELYQAETERIWAQKGVSPYGNNNVFGNVPGLLLNRK